MEFFTKREEQELAEIRASHHALLERMDVVLEQLERVTKTHHQLKGYGPRPSVARAASGAPLLAFVHIPKTAGGTVASMLATAYQGTAVHAAGNYLRFPEDTVAKVAKRAGGWKGLEEAGVMVGHVPFGIYRDHLPSTARYMVFLREPLDRVLSHYYRHIHIPATSRGGRVKRQTLDRAEKIGRVKAESLEEALVDLRLPDVSNLATRFLCDDPGVDELTATALEEAKANLRRFAFVGLQERFWESVVLLQRTLGVALVPSEGDRHVNAERPAVEEITPKERVLIAEHNRLDTELYAFAAGLFEDALAAGGGEIESEAERLRGLAAAANEKGRAIQAGACNWLADALPPGKARPADDLREAAHAAGISDLTLKRAARVLDVTKRADGTVWVRGEDRAPERRSAR